MANCIFFVQMFFDPHYLVNPEPVEIIFYSFRAAVASAVDIVRVNERAIEGNYGTLHCLGPPRPDSIRIDRSSRNCQLPQTNLVAIFETLCRLVFAGLDRAEIKV